jgi:hypothetical protein
MFRRVSLLPAALWFGVVVLAGTVVTSSQTGAQVLGSNQCCTPAQNAVETSATGWIVQAPPSGSVVPAVTITPYVSWHAPLGTSHWIANVANAYAPGYYTYVYRFCLCAQPKGLRQSATTMFVSILADNEFKAYVNSTGPFLQGGGYSFQNPTSGSPPSNAFLSGWNTLKIVVHNDSSVTGLDVSGWIAGYFTRCDSKPTPLPSISPYNPGNPTTRQRKASNPTQPPT